MLETRRAFYFQLGTVVLVLAGLVFLSRFVDVLGAILSAQQAVMNWGAWSGVFYPFLFALCNVLLLPGGILCVGSGFFFGLWWGFFIVLVGNAIGAALSFALSRSLLTGAIRRRLSDSRLLHFLEPNECEIPDLHALDDCWPGTGVVRLCLSWNARPARP